jgi:hypothetical protein
MSGTWDVFTGTATVPPGVLTELTALQAVLPGYKVNITSEAPGYRYEAIRRGDGPGTWCVVSSDPGDLWRELAGRARPAALDGDILDRALLMARLTISTYPYPLDRIPALPVVSPATDSAEAGLRSPKFRPASASSVSQEGPTIMPIPAAPPHAPAPSERNPFRRALAALTFTTAAVAAAACGSSRASTSGGSAVEKPDLTVAQLRGTAVAVNVL